MWILLKFVSKGPNDSISHVEAWWSIYGSVKWLIPDSVDGFITYLASVASFTDMD